MAITIPVEIKKDSSDETKCDSTCMFLSSVAAMQSSLGPVGRCLLFNQALIIDNAKKIRCDQCKDVA